jgi:hypothetical protein
MMEPAFQPPRETRRQDLPPPGFGHGPSGGNSFGALVQQPNIEPRRQEFQGPPRTREEDAPVYSSLTSYGPQPLPAATQSGPTSYVQRSGSATAARVDLPTTPKGQYRQPLPHGEPVRLHHKLTMEDIRPGNTRMSMEDTSLGSMCQLVWPLLATTITTRLGPPRWPVVLLVRLRLQRPQ